MNGKFFTQHRFSFGDCCVAVGERSPPDALVATQDAVSSQRILFFLHGRFGSGACWQRVIEPLQDRYRCLAPDLPGFGQSFSSRERGLSLLEHAHLVRHLIGRFAAHGESVALVGHDIGGVLALMCAAGPRGGLAGRIDSLSLINCAGLTEPSHGFKTGLFGMAARTLISRCRSAAKLLGREDEKMLLEPWLSPDSRAALVRAFRALEDSWPGPFERQFWRREVSKLHTPVLMLWGSLDRVNPRESGLGLARALPYAAYFEEETCGHWPLLEKPEWVAAKLQEFLFHVAGEKKSA